MLLDDSMLANASPKVQRAFLDEQCRRSYEAFCYAAYSMLYPGKVLNPRPYLSAMLHRYGQLARGECNRLVANVPPRHGKSEFGTCMLAAWVIGRDPTAKVMVVTYGLKLSLDLTKKIRQIMTHPHYLRIFPETRLQVGKNRAEHFVTTKGGECRAESQESGVTGLGTHYMLIDDFQMADDALSPVQRENAIRTFKNTLVSRFDNLAQGKILINQQRLHLDDISGWALDFGWPHLCLRAIAEEDQTYELTRGRTWYCKKGELLDAARCSLQFLEDQRLMQGPRYFNAQYQQNPGTAEGGLIHWLWFGQYHEMPSRREFLKIVQVWDPAITERLHSDYSVGMTWGYREGQWYLLDLIRAKMAFTALQERLIAWHRQWRADALVIEGASIGHSLYDWVKHSKVPGKILCPTPRGSKLDRLAGRTAQLETGDYLLPASAPWLADLKRELLAFPEGPNDDQVDALSLFLEFAFGNERWTQTEYDSNGRPQRIVRTSRRPRTYKQDQ
jgi:predicted phage terminase large subunit-like protein